MACLSPFPLKPKIAELSVSIGAEQQRAEVLAGWWSADGLMPRADAVGNVWALAAPGNGPAILLCAHLDTVFGPQIRHEVRAANGRLIGPGVGDDTVALAALAAIGILLAGDWGPLWLVATVGEEGTGNLSGIRHALATAPQPVGAVIAVEGNYLGRVVNVGVGSVRWRVAFTGPGGHAWERSTAPSAVHAAAAAAARLAALTVPGARCSVNIGSIGGGEAINARARSAWLEVDLRADAADALGQLENRATEALTAVTPTTPNTFTVWACSVRRSR